MRAIAVENFGDEPRLMELPDPEPGPGEGLVGRGTFADRVAIAERPSHGALELVPEGLKPGLAAAVPTVGMTAEGTLAKTGCRPGQHS